MIRRAIPILIVWSAAPPIRRREATGDQGIGSTAEREILDQELGELALEWMMNPQSPPVPNLPPIR